LTRLWFLISIGSGGNDPLVWSHGIVVDAQEIVQNEIWTITMRTPPSQPGGTSRVEIFYVLEQTCEVVGHPLPPVHPIDPSVGSNEFALVSNTIQVRADWSAYIAHRQLPPSSHDSPPLPLLDHLKWQNHEEYHRGLSKLWLNRIADEGELGSAKKIVAERYVLACVVGNRYTQLFLSPKISSDQDIPASAGAGCLLLKWNKILRATRLSFLLEHNRRQSTFLFLREFHCCTLAFRIFIEFYRSHHHVESLHFTAINGNPLHEALAVVQTPGREYYILRDNGAQVGCGLGEVDGVGPVWMELLGCTTLGERA
jgi:hypothetical protein